MVIEIFAVIRVLDFRVGLPVSIFVLLAVVAVVVFVFIRVVRTHIRRHATCH